MSYPKHVLDAIKERADLAAIVGAKVNLRREGRDLVGLCPFHNEKSPSFHVTPGTGLFHCYGCGASGSVFEWMQKQEGLSFPDAVRRLAAELGVALGDEPARPAVNSNPAAGKVLPIEGGRRRRAIPADDDPSEPAADDDPKDAEREATKLRAGAAFRACPWSPDVVEKIEATLWTDPGAEPVHAYLLQKRRLSEAALREFHVGAVVVRDGAGKVLDLWAAIPIYDRDRRVQNVKLRAIPGPCPACSGSGCARCAGSGAVPAKPKYLALPRRPLPLFGADRLDGNAKSPVYVEEGEFDVIGMWQYGWTANVVSGTAGAAKWDDSWLDEIEPYEQAVLMYDPDEAGQKGGDALAAKLGREKCVRVTLPHKDIGECIERGVPTETIQRAVRMARPMTGLSIVRPSSFAAEIEARIADPEKMIGFATGSAKVDACLGGDRPGLTVVTGDSGCLTGETMVMINRAGKGGRMRLDHIVHMQNGGKAGGKRWDMSIPTRVQCSDDGFGRLAILERAIVSGVKPVFRVEAGGHSVRGSADHPFLTPRGWVRLRDLRVGDEVFRLEHPVKGPKSPKKQYKPVCVSSAHPFHVYVEQMIKRYGDRSDEPRHLHRAWRVAEHRLVAEAQLNGIPYPTFLRRVKAGDIAGLRFLDPSAYAVHHIDENPRNNDPSNLMVMTHDEHKRHHGEDNAGNVLWRNVAYRIDSIEPDGEEQTYDLSLAEEPHNFTANGFVVHNSGKTTWTCWQAWERARIGVGVLTTAFEQSPVMFAEKLLRLQIGGDFTQASAEDRAAAWAALDALPLYVIGHHGQTTYDDILATVRYAVRRLDVRFALLDHLGYVIAPDAADKVAEIERVVKGLALASTSEGWSCWLVAHPSNQNIAQQRRVQMGDLKGASAIRQEAAAVIVVERNAPSPSRSFPSTTLHFDKVRAEWGLAGSSCWLAFDPAATRYADAWEQTPMGAKLGGRPPPTMPGSPVESSAVAPGSTPSTTATGRRRREIKPDEEPPAPPSSPPVSTRTPREPERTEPRSDWFQRADRDEYVPTTGDGIPV